MVADKEFARRLLTAVEAKLLTLRRLKGASALLRSGAVHRSAESVEGATNDIELAHRLSSYVYSDPFPVPRDMDPFYLACLYLRYERRELSWATFLDLAGRYIDAKGGDPPGEYYYEMLNVLEDSEFDVAIEGDQARKVQTLLGPAIDEVQREFGSVLRRERP